MPRHMLEAQEAADYLKISVWTLYDKAKKGFVPHVKIGRRVIFSQEGLDQWMEDQETKSVQDPKKRLEEKMFGNVRRLKS